MKKKIISAVIGLAMLTTAIPAIAETVNVYQNQKLVKSVVFQIGRSDYFVNDKAPGVKMDVAPYIENDRTFVPVRFLGNALGVGDNNIGWDGSSHTVTMNQPGMNSVKMAICSTTITSNEQPTQMDVTPVLKNDRTFLPARFVAEALGYEVRWDEGNKVISCYPKGTTEPDIGNVMQYILQNPVQNQVQQQQPVPTTGRLANGGYAIPANTDLQISVDKDGSYPKNQIDFSICLKKGNLQQQYADAKSIISQTVDADTVNAAIDFAKQVQDALLSKKPWDIKDFKSPNGMTVRIGAGWGGESVEFQVWSTN